MSTSSTFSLPLKKEITEVSLKSEGGRVNTFKIQSLPHEVILFLMEFVDNEDRLEFVRCCREWYHWFMRKFVRKLSIRKPNDEVSITKIKRLVTNPFDQVSVSWLNCNETINSDILLAEMSYSLHEMECNMKQFNEVMSIIYFIRVKNLVIEGIDGTSNHAFQAIIDNITRVKECETLIFYFQNGMGSNVIPYLPSVKDLWIRNATRIDQSIWTYTNTLHLLSLHNCDISDVSSLGSIPNVGLKGCNYIVDISPLNNNDCLEIDRCSSVTDYSQSFVHSRRICINIVQRRNEFYVFDMTKWTKVEELILGDFTYNRTTESFAFQSSSQLPKTVKRLSIGGIFASIIDFTVTPDHRLHEIKFIYNKSLTSLQGYGLERVAIIECWHMNALESLEGLGRGRNRKIVIKHCHKITDFSPLNHISIVQIIFCKGFSNPFQVRFVRDLKIIPSNPISFISYLVPDNIYENNYSLTLAATEYLQSFEGLATIPHLRLDLIGYHHIRRFLEEGERIQNQRIVLYDEDIDNRLLDALTYLHNRFMEDRYDYSCKPKQWVWFRKK